MYRSGGGYIKKPPPGAGACRMNFSPTIFAPVHDVGAQLRQYTEVEAQEKQILDSEIAGLRDQLDEYKKQKTDQEMGRAGSLVLRQELKTLKYRIRTLEKERDAAAQESAAFRREIESLKQDKFDKISELTGLKMEVRQLEDVIRNRLETKLRNYKRLVKTLRAENEVLQGRAQAAEERLQELSIAHERLSDTNRELQAENQHLQRTLMENLEKMKNLKVENEKLRSPGPTSPRQPRATRRILRDLPPSPRPEPEDPRTAEEPVKKTQIVSVRVVGKRSMLKQCGFKFQLEDEDQDRSFILEEVCTKYCDRYGLDMKSMVFTNYKGDVLSMGRGHDVQNGDIIYVNYK